ncbi:uncharacterized protein LOC123656558 [Melitaea cinxia]|nr:uncharacterized protein LOC123656558 [Melitaea cinxia]
MLEHDYCITYDKPSEKRTKKGVKSSTDNKICSLRSEISRLRKKGTNLKARLNNAVKLSKNPLFYKFTKDMTRPAKLFTQMQVYQTSKKPKGRRYTTDEKILCLSMYKKSPKCYNVLSKFFTLPSAKAMKRLLAKIKIKSGINTILFEKIKKTVADKDISDCLCSLIFDEMAITPQIHYNTQKDVLQGFDEEGKKFANHVLVFMIKGIKENFKQPVAYYFTNSLNTYELKKIIKIVIRNVQDTGLIILNTVCDQSTVNVSAITSLINDTKKIYFKKGKEWRHDVIQINKQSLIPLYDVPHLIKGIRNNLITKNLKYKINNEEKIMKWEYLEMLYAADKSYGELRLLQKITEEHVNPEKMSKMRAKK